jgi:hypothetical protein
MAPNFTISSFSPEEARASITDALTDKAAQPAGRAEDLGTIASGILLVLALIWASRTLLTMAEEAQ